MRDGEPDLRVQYVRNLFVSEDELLVSIREELREDGKAINVSPEEGKILQFFIKVFKAKTVLEIGTLYGYSAIWMVRGLPKDGKLYTIEKEGLNYLRAEKNFRRLNKEDRDKINLIGGVALEKLSEISSSSFDAIFIDADKINYLNYLDWAEKNVEKGGLIIADNTFLSGAVYLEELPGRVRKTTREVMRDFNKRLSDPEKYYSIIIPTKEGMTVAVKLF